MINGFLFDITDGEYVGFIDIFNDSEALPPSFEDTYKVIPFNRFMEIRNIDNPAVVLKMSEIVVDLWEITFETTESGSQNFLINIG